jgi:thiamine-monophosphate kinase
LIISITAIGEADEEEIVYETEPNKPTYLLLPVILVQLIWDYKFLRKTSFQVNPNSQPDLDAYTYLIEQLRPEARKDVRTLLHALEIKPTL